jgi:hypothetical protein
MATQDNARDQTQERKSERPYPPATFISHHSSIRGLPEKESLKMRFPLLPQHRGLEWLYGKRAIISTGCSDQAVRPEKQKAGPSSRSPSFIASKSGNPLSILWQSPEQQNGANPVFSSKNKCILGGCTADEFSSKEKP